MGLRLRIRPFLIARYGVLLVMATITLFPMVWIGLGSLKTLEQLFAIPIQWLPNPVQLSNYPNAIISTGFARPLLNSLIVTASQIAINLVVCSLAGFAFAKYRFRGKELIFLAVLAMTLLPIQVIMIPLFAIVKYLGWINTYQGLIIPTAVAPLGVFLMRQFIVSIPSDYIDAARVDGAGEFTIFRRIILPMSVPALVTLAMLVALGSWDEFLWPLIVVGKNEMATAPLAISYLRSLYQTPAHYVLAVAAVMTIPPLLAFLFGQKRILQSVGQTGLKG